MHWQNNKQIKKTLEATFKRILAVRLHNLPVINAALTVQAIGFEKIGDSYPGVLITPWFMNLILLPTADSKWRTMTPGNQFEQAFPCGSFIFTLAFETHLGIYAQCSLFSPMFEFENQAAAQIAAQAALQELMTSPGPRTVSRRDLIRGQLGNR